MKNLVCYLSKQIITSINKLSFSSNINYWRFSLNLINGEMETIFQLNIMHEVELKPLKMHMYALIKTPPHPHVHAHVCFWSDPLPLTAYILYGCPLRCSRPFNSITRPVTKSMVVVFANSVKKLKGFTRWGRIKRKDQGCTPTVEIVPLQVLLWGCA